MRQLALGCLLLAWCSAALAQYAHKAWRITEGFARSYPTSMAQTPDGYLWLGTEFGLLRFDGVRTTAWRPPAGATLRNDHIRALFAARDGTLWIGTLEGLASWREGKLTQLPSFASLVINSLAEDREGTIWVTAYEPPHAPRLCTIRKSGASCETDYQVLGEMLGSVYVDSRDRLWLTSRAGLWQWRPGPPRLYEIAKGISGSLQGLAEGASGSMLALSRGNVVQVADGAGSAASFGPALPTQAARILRDRHGALWVGTFDRGLLHVHDGRVETYTRADGLSGDSIARLLEDREGNIWVSTFDGLDRFSEVAATTYSTEQGTPNALVAAALATRDGSIWISTRTGLHRWHDGQGTFYVGQRAAAQTSGVPEVRIDGLPDRPASLFEDSRGRLWIGSDAGLGYLEHGRFTAIAGVPTAYIDAIVEDREGTVWIAQRQAGLFSIAMNGSMAKIPWPQLGHEDGGVRLAIDPLRTGLWLGFELGGIAHVTDGRVDLSKTAADGLSKGRVYWLRADPDGTLWIAADGGLSRLKDGRIATLTAGGGLPCDGVDWMAEDDSGDVWIYTECGMLRTTRAERDAAFAARQRGVTDPLLHATNFDMSDGVRSTSGVGSYSPHFARSPDGRIWFATLGGVGVLDPQRIPHNSLAPPVYIEQVIADRRRHETSLASAPLALPPLTRDLQIDYTALSLTAPEKMRFRYRLEGHDRAWREVGTRRQAFYTDLPPGDYRFNVIASNNDGVWNEQGASLDLSIAPTFYQTQWFAGLCIALAAATLWLLLWLRGKQIETRMRVRLEERVLERERIARDLHDTFLQSVQGLVLRFHAVLGRLPQESVAGRMLEQALGRADEVINEGRDRVYNLRQSAQASIDLPQALTAAAEELAETSDTKFRVLIEGTPRPLHPVVREEAYRIGVEALSNAFRHAAARNIEVLVEYGRKSLGLRVVDDGRGYDVAVLEDLVAQGHFGLAGLRERAHRIRAQLEVSSRAGAGSAVELRVPASIAYATGRGKPWD
jgi:signal transduction histidine kinase/ligand-binding sensor domain-containing protein